MELQCWSIWLATRRQSRRGGGWRGLKSLLMSSSGSGGSPLTCLCWFSCCCGQNKHTPVSNTLSAGFPVAVHSTITPQSVILFLMVVMLLWTGLSNLSLCHYLLGLLVGSNIQTQWTYLKRRPVLRRANAYVIVVWSWLFTPPTGNRSSR